MSRFVSLFVVIAFISQHFVCCCDAMATRVCDQDRHTVDGSLAAGFGSGCCAHRHHSHQSKNLTSHGNRSKSEPAQPGGVPRHEHHLCVAAHTFFVQSQKAELPRSVGSTYGVLTIECGASEGIPMTRHGLLERTNGSPPLSPQARRATMCVYRI